MLDAVGQVAAPLTYKSTESPTFPTGFKATMGTRFLPRQGPGHAHILYAAVCLVLAIALMCTYTYVLPERKFECRLTGLLISFSAWRENVRREKLGQESHQDRAFHDLTDKGALCYSGLKKRLGLTTTPNREPHLPLRALKPTCEFTAGSDCVTCRTAFLFLLFCVRPQVYLPSVKTRCNRITVHNETGRRAAKPTILLLVL
jgi:hypothetical protein